MTSRPTSCVRRATSTNATTASGRTGRPQKKASDARRARTSCRGSTTPRSPYAGGAHVSEPSIQRCTKRRCQPRSAGCLAPWHHALCPSLPVLCSPFHGPIESPSRQIPLPSPSPFPPYTQRPVSSAQPGLQDELEREVGSAGATGACRVFNGLNFFLGLQEGRRRRQRRRRVAAIITAAK